MIRNLDDKAQVDDYQGQDATVIKAEARITGPGTQGDVHCNNFAAAGCGRRRQRNGHRDSHLPEPFRVDVTLVHRGPRLMERNSTMAHR
ncbi:hypothetical protein ACFWIX_08750 [Pseudarthrobacter sp. NPDC058362]|uniref:hypothetical protein n=1 Tax=unclassified Pseudarthrobacter TaxID=2647000 RepID=UPI0036509F4C